LNHSLSLIHKYLLDFAAKRPLALALVGGLALILCWPPFSAFPIHFICFVPLLALAQTPQAKSIRTMFLLSSFVFAIWGIGTLYWIAKASVFSCLGAILIHTTVSAAVFTLWLAATQYFTRLAKNKTLITWLSYALFCFSWVTLESAKERLLNFPWLNLGMSLASHPQFIQFYEVTGPYGGTLFLLVSNILLFESLASGRRSVVTRFAAVIWVTGLLGFSVYRYYSVNDYASPVEVRVVQGRSTFFKPSGKPQPKLLDSLIALSAKNAARNTEFFIWPESAFEPWHAVNEDSLEGSSGIEKIRAFLVPYWHGNVIFGALTYKTDSKHAADTLWYNSAVCLSADQRIQVYHKQRLVPGSEGMVFGLSQAFSSRGSFGRYLNEGTSQNNFYARSGIGTAPVICFESAFSEDVTRKVSSGVQFISVITNDAWWGRTSGTYQHLAYARLLAIENRRWVLRSSLGGISAVIDTQGNVMSSLQSENSGVLQVAINAAEEPTYYTMHGDFLVKCCLLGAGLIILVLFVLKFLSRGLTSPKLHTMDKSLRN